MGRIRKLTDFEKRELIEKIKYHQRVIRNQEEGHIEHFSVLRTLIKRLER